MSKSVTYLHVTDVTVTQHDRGVAAGRGYCECVVYSEYDDPVSALPQLGGARVARAPLHPHSVPTQPRHYERWGHRDTRGEEMGAGVVLLTINTWFTGSQETW